jgi:sialic acid synthase SpsE
MQIYKLIYCISVDILRCAGVPFCLMQCTSIYPTPYDKVNLGALDDLASAFPDALLGLSDHSKGIWTCVGACAKSAVVLEKHFVSDKTWPGPDVDVSIDPDELKTLRIASNVVWEASKGKKKIILPEEQVTIDFAYSCVVSIATIDEGEIFTMENIWCKRPGTGQIKAGRFDEILGKKAACKINADVHLKLSDVSGL